MTTEESDELFKEIMGNKQTEVKLMLSKIDEMLEKDLTNESYEDCARLRDMIAPFNNFVNGNALYEDIKEDLDFAKNKFDNLLQDAITKASIKKK